MPDGSSVAQNNGLRKMRDGKGNRINVFATEDLPGVFTTHHVDHQTGREIQSVYDASNPNSPIGHVKYQTVFGGWATMDIVFRNSAVIGQAYLIGDAICPDAASLPADSSFGVLDSIVLPQTEPGQPQRKFIFTYSSDSTVTVNYTYRLDCTQNPPIQVTSASRGFGSLSSVTLPTGARVEYSYLLDIDINGLPTGPLQDANDAAADRIVRKTVTHDGISDVWNYSINTSGSSVSGPEGSVSQNYYPRALWAQHLYGGLDGKGGLVYRTNQSNKVITERHWIHNSFGTNPGSPAQATGAMEAAAFNPLVDFEYTTLLDQSGTPLKMSTKAMQYDFNGNLKSATEYDFVDLTQVTITRDLQGIPVGLPPGAVALRTTTNTYYNPADTGTSANIYAKRLTASATPRILSALQTSVTGASQSEFYYDGSLDLNTAPSGGNLTKERRSEGTKWIQATHTYDPNTANLTSTTDPNLNLTQFFYDATKALPSSVVVDPNNQISGDELTTQTAYDFWTGLVTIVTDPNGRSTSSDYTNQLLLTVDPFGRPGVVTDPQGRKTATRYFDNARQLEVWSDLNGQFDAKLRSRSSADQLGRPTKTESSEDGVSYTIFADTVYQQMGKITITTNPMRASSTSTDGWTRATKDDLGRVLTVETFSGRYPSGTLTGTVTTSYNAHATTVTDQASKTRRSITDGLGRLIRVDEPDSFGSLGSVTAPTQPTSYTYDSRGNLTQVAQGSQTRSFIYDGLSRLKQATNPESGTISYTYDDNGNLKTKTDARGVVTTFAYDGFNRVVTRTYSGTQPGPSTPAVTYVYDTLGAGLNGKGRLTSVSSSVSSYSYGSYDVMGRVVTGTQSTDGQNYAMSYQYNLAGAATSETYPSGRVVVTEYDSAARIAGVKNQATAAYWVGAAPSDVTNRIQYAAHGAVSVMKLGNSKWEHTNYNSRLQPEQIGLGTSSADSSTLRLDYTYGSTNNNGNVQTQRIVAGSLDVTQSYTYDELNRLKTANESSGTNWSQTYGYDRWGNRWVSASTGYTLSSLTPTASGAFNTANNRLFASGYDTAGNQTSDLQGRTFEYDGENRQTKFNATAGQYFYDGDGRRVKKIDTNGTVTTVFVYNAGGQLIAEYHSDPVPPAAGGGGTSYLTSDHLGSTRVVTKADGSVKARYDYLPFGEELGSGIGGRTVGMGYSGADSTNQKFTQKERDNESGLDYFGARYYSSAQGRFTGPDAFWKDSQVVDPQSWNKYAYVRNNPLRLVDQGGEKATVNIVTDEEKKTGTITITASIAIYSQGNSNFTQQQLNQAAAAIQSSIQSAWSGTYKQDGITYTVGTKIDVQVYGSENDATKSGAQNVIGISKIDAKPGEASSFVDARGLLSRGSAPDTGVWRFSRIVQGGVAAHEFTHLLGVDDRHNGGNISTTGQSVYPMAVQDDYGWALSGGIRSHRNEGRQYYGNGNSLETRSSPGFKLGPPVSHTSTRELRAAKIWWN